MGMQVGNHEEEEQFNSTINTTPLVDVMLVLLVVFMISAPLMTVGVPVDLPKTNASQMVGQDEPLVVSVSAKGEVFLQETQVGLEQLVVPRLGRLEDVLLGSNS